MKIFHIVAVITNAIAQTHKASAEDVDVAAMCTQQAAQQVHTSGGEVAIWRVQGTNVTAIGDAERGQFFAGDSYIVRYTYTENGMATGDLLPLKMC